MKHKKVENLVPVQHVFEDFRHDTPYIIDKLVQADWERIVIQRFVENFEQQRKIKNNLTCNFIMLNEIYIYLRSISKSYPYLKPNNVSDFFIEKLGYTKRNQVQIAKIRSICRESSILINTSWLSPEEIDENSQILRYSFFEILIRLS